MSQGHITTFLTLAFLAATLGTGCSGRALFIGNVVVAAVPCVLMYVTLNLKK